jgi:hypothetical protein
MTYSAMLIGPSTPRLKTILRTSENDLTCYTLNTQTFTMATSSHPSMASQSASTQVIAHSALKVAQAFSTIVPPAYLVTSLILRRGRGFSVRGLATTSFGGVVAGAGIGGVAAWARLRDQPTEAIEDRAFRLVRPVRQLQM